MIKVCALFLKDTHASRHMQLPSPYKMAMADIHESKLTAETERNKTTRVLCVRDYRANPITTNNAVANTPVECSWAIRRAAAALAVVEGELLSSVDAASTDDGLEPAGTVDEGVDELDELDEDEEDSDDSYSSVALREPHLFSFLHFC